MKRFFKTFARTYAVKKLVDISTHLLARAGYGRRSRVYAPGNIALAASAASLLGSGILGAVQPRRRPLFMGIPASPESQRSFVQGYNRAVSRVIGTPRTRRIVAAGELAAGAALALGAWRAISR